MNFRHKPYMFPSLLKFHCSKTYPNHVNRKKNIHIGYLMSLFKLGFLLFPTRGYHNPQTSRIVPVSNQSIFVVMSPTRCSSVVMVWALGGACCTEDFTSAGVAGSWMAEASVPGTAETKAVNGCPWWFPEIGVPQNHPCFLGADFFFLGFSIINYP